MANNSQSPGAQSLWPPAGSLPQNYGSSVQYRPVIPAQHGQPFAPPVLHQFRPIGQGISSSNVMLPGGQDQPPHYPHPMQQLPPRSGQPGHVPPPQPLPMAYAQASRPLSSSSSQPLQSAPQYSNQISGAPPAPPYTFMQSFGQTQTTSVPSPLQPMSQMSASTVPAQPWMPSGTQGVSPMMPAQQAGQQPIAAPIPETTNAPTSSQQSLSDWQEHEAANGRRYYYNKKTKQSSWEKPMELMTPIERADASTVWKEFSTSDGRKYYYNKVTKQSVWSMPEEMKLARERALKADGEGESTEAAAGSQVPATAGGESIEVSSAANVVTSSSSTYAVVSSSPAAVAPALPATSAAPTAVSDPSIAPAVTSSTLVSDEVGGQTPAHGVPPVAIAASAAISPALVNANASMSNFHNAMPREDGASSQEIEEAKKGMAVAGKVNVSPLEEKAEDDEPLVYANKQEAKNAFKSLLESVNVQSDWTWEQVMREIVNDKRYGALKTLGERKQAFNEYLGQRKKLEAEERRMKQKKAREEFTKMLEECQELTSLVKWSKAVSMFENDERFKAVERSRDREELYENYIVELVTKEKEKAAEEHRRNVAEYRKYLESCDFIKVNSQWRKVVDRLEDDERSSRLEKIDRLLVFQDYIRDLEKEEEEARKIQKEQLRRSERKNRDEFRKLMDRHVSDGSLTAKTYWRDYCQKVKETPEYQAVASNTSGSTPKDLFEDVTGELEKQYHEDKSRIKDVVKSRKISVALTWTMDDFKAAVVEDLSNPPISDVNLKLVYEDLLERAKEKEEKEAKKRQRLADDFSKLLHTIKEIPASSNWEECKPLFEESQEFKSMGEESFSKEIFEEYILHLQEKAKEKERRREEEKLRKEKEREEKDKRKEKERKEKEKEREKERGKEKSRKDETDSDTGDVNDSHGYKDDKKREKDKDRKHRKRHQSVAEDVSSDKDEKDSKRSRRHGGDRKKSKKHGHSPESDSESRHKRHKRDHRDSSRRNGGYEELEDGELGEDGEIQ